MNSAIFQIDNLPCYHSQSNVQAQATNAISINFLIPNSPVRFQKWMLTLSIFGVYIYIYYNLFRCNVTMKQKDRKHCKAVVLFPKMQFMGPSLWLHARFLAAVCGYALCWTLSAVESNIDQQVLARVPVLQFSLSLSLCKSQVFLPLPWKSANRYLLETCAGSKWGRPIPQYCSGFSDSSAKKEKWRRGDRGKLDPININSKD